MEKADTSVVEASGVIQRATAKSKQPRFTGPQEALRVIFQNMERWSKEAVMVAPARSQDNRLRDAWLADFYKQEPLFSGVLSSIISIDKNRGWELVGGRNQVNRYSNVLRNVENGAGWRVYASKQSESYWTQDVGGITEVGRFGKRGPMGALWHVDSSKVVVTGKPKTPLTFYASNGKEQQWTSFDYFQSLSMPSPQSSMRGVGYSAVSRAMDLAIIMIAIYRHDREMLQSAMQKGILLMQGIDDVAWEEAMVINSELLTQREQEYFAGVSILFGSGDLDGKMLRLSELPENFDLTEFTNVLMNGYALCVGFDAREFWPVSQGSLGTGNETELQAIKASGKGGLDFALSYQDNLQRELPATLHFEFEQRNETGLIAQSESILKYAQAVNEMAAPASNMDTVTLTAEERRQLYAMKGYIPEEWTAQQEDVVETDTEERQVREMRQRMLDNVKVRMACERYPDEPIVRVTWPGYQHRIIWQSGADALHRQSYPGAWINRAEEIVYYEEGDVKITEEDVSRAVKNWDKRQEEENRGILDAVLVEE